MLRSTHSPKQRERAPKVTGWLCARCGRGGQHLRRRLRCPPFRPPPSHRESKRSGAGVGREARRGADRGGPPHRPTLGLTLSPPPRTPTTTLSTSPSSPSSTSRIDFGSHSDVVTIFYLQTVWSAAAASLATSCSRHLDPDSGMSSSFSSFSSFDQHSEISSATVNSTTSSGDA